MQTKHINYSGVVWAASGMLAASSSHCNLHSLNVIAGVEAAKAGLACSSGGMAVLKGQRSSATAWRDVKGGSGGRGSGSSGCIVLATTILQLQGGFGSGHCT